MKCKNCNGELILNDGVLICRSCGSKYSIQEYYEDTEVYLCYLENDDSGRRTKDSAIAQEIYYFLEGHGITAFYKRISGEEFSGDTAQVVDDVSLDRSRVVLLVGTSRVHYGKLWDQYSERIEGKKIIPVFQDMNAYHIPDEIKHLQALKYDTVGASADLLKGVSVALGRPIESEDDYTSLNKKARHKRAVMFIVIGIVAAVVAAVVIMSVLLSSKKQEFAATETEVEEAENVIYDKAVEHMNKEEYADAIKEFSKIADYRDSSTLLQTCYAKYAGYYVDEGTGLNLHFQVYDNNTGAVELYGYGANNEKCSISESISIIVDSAKIAYTDSENNAGTIHLDLENKGIHIQLENTETNSDVYIPNADVRFLLSDKSDQPIREQVTAEFLKGILTDRTTIRDLERQGYEVVYDRQLVSDGGCYEHGNVYKIKDTEVYLETLDYDVALCPEVYYFAGIDANEMDGLELEEPVIFAIQCPASILGWVDSTEYKEPFLEDGFLFFPGCVLGYTSSGMLELEGSSYYLQNESDVPVCFCAKSTVGDLAFNRLIKECIVEYRVEEQCKKDHDLVGKSSPMANGCIATVEEETDEFYIVSASVAVIDGTMTMSNGEETNHWGYVSYWYKVYKDDYRIEEMEDYGKISPELDALFRRLAGSWSYGDGGIMAIAPAAEYNAQFLDGVPANATWVYQETHDSPVTDLDVTDYTDSSITFQTQNGTYVLELMGDGGLSSTYISGYDGAIYSKIGYK